MITKFVPLKFDHNLAYSEGDGTIRTRLDEPIPGLSAGWEISIVIRETIRPNHWESGKGLVYDQPFIRVNYGGMTDAERDRLTPRVCSGLSAELIRGATLVRNSWRIDTPSIFGTYRKKAEQGYEFTSEELKAHQREEMERWERERDSIKTYLPDELFDVIYAAVKEYCQPAGNKLSDAKEDALKNLALFFKKGHEMEAKTMLDQIGNKTGKEAAEIVFSYRNSISDGNEVLNRIFEPIATIKGWEQGKRNNWNKQIANLKDKQLKRDKMSNVISSGVK